MTELMIFAKVMLGTFTAFCWALTGYAVARDDMNEIVTWMFLVSLISLVGFGLIT